jgi:hypothetical protein
LPGGTVQLQLGQAHFTSSFIADSFARRLAAEPPNYFSGFDTGAERFQLELRSAAGRAAMRSLCEEAIAKVESPLSAGGCELEYAPKMSVRQEVVRPSVCAVSEPFRPRVD